MALWIYVLYQVGQHANLETEGKVYGSYSEIELKFCEFYVYTNLAASSAPNQAFPAE